jgi:hypothetical protein
MSALEPSSLSVTYRHVQRLTGLQLGAQDWCYQVAGIVGGERVAVAEGCAVLVDLFGPDPCGSLRIYDRHIRHIGAVAFDPATGELDPSWGHDLEMLGDRLLILGEVTVGSRWRADGLVPLISAMVVTRLRHCAVAAMYAIGADWSDLADDTADDRAGDRADDLADGLAVGLADGVAVGRADELSDELSDELADELASMREAGLALRPARDGVYYLDPATVRLDLALGRHASRRPVLL